MKTKIIGILVCMLLISTAMTTIAVNENNLNFNESRSYKPVDVPPSWLEGADQYQTDDYEYGMAISPLFHVAQEFKPTKEDLTAVALYFFNLNAPPNVEITVAIRETLDGSDLTTMTLDADSKKIKTSRWVMFDFDDITVIPEETYYIVCYASDGIVDNCYCWYFDVENEYDRGIAWESEDSGETWTDLEDPGWGPDFVEIDLCFITYFQEPPKNKAININQLFLRFLEQHPHMFPILRHMLGL